MPITPIPANAGCNSAGTIVSTIMAAQSKSVELTLEGLLKNKDQYFRANPTLERYISLDQLDPNSLRLLKAGAESQKSVIEKFVASEPVRRRLERVADSQ